MCWKASVQRSGNQVRVTAQLIDAETDTHLWAERFAGDSGDLFALQDEITSRIAAALDLELVNTEASRPIERPDTRDYIFRGRAERLKPPSRENRAEAITLFEQALALDPNSVVAQSWLAVALTARALDSMAETAAADIARAEELAERALAALPALGRAFRQGPGVARAAPICRGHSRIRDRHRAQPELGARLFPSRLVQIHDRVDRGAGPGSGEGYPAQPARSPDRLVLQPDRIGASASVAHRRGNRLVRKGAQRRPGAPPISCLPRRRLRA